MEQDISELCETKEFRRGDIILEQGEKVDGMYIIKSGQVDVVRDDEVIATLKEGDFFGAMGLILHERRSATVRVASEILSAVFLSKEIYEEVQEELGKEILEKVLQRYSETYKKYI